MNCFQHQSSPAVACCKSCSKGVCAQCALESVAGISCSAACQDFALKIDQMNRSALKIYGIGEKRSLVPPGALIYLFMGLIFLAFGVLELARSPDFFVSPAANGLVFFMLCFGLLFIAIGGWAWRRQRRFQINC